MTRRPLLSLRSIVGTALIVVGGVWFFQGIGWLKGSFMTGDSTYTYVGGSMVVVGIGLVIWQLRSRRD